MERDLLEEYARLLTTDTRACAGLFALDAEYFTRVGSHDLHLRGREDIENFLVHVPRQLCFRAVTSRSTGSTYGGEVHIQAEGMSACAHAVLYSLDRGRFKRFEVIRG